MRVPLAIAPPKRIIGLNADLKPVHYRLRLDWLGRAQVVEQSEFTPFAAKEHCWLVLTPELLFSRQQNLPVTERAALQRLAADFFPFAAEQTSYAQTQEDGANELFALRDQDWQNFKRLLPAPPIAVLPSRLDKIAVQHALAQRLQHHALTDLHPQPVRFYPPPLLRLWQWILLWVVLAALGYAVLAGALDWQNKNRQQQLIRFEENSTGLRDKNQALQRMQGGMAALNDFGTEPPAALYPVLSRLFATIPVGHSLDRIEFKDNQLRISGLGPQPQSWLGGFGVAVPDVQITVLPQMNRYAATIPIVPPPPQ